METLDNRLLEIEALLQGGLLETNYAMLTKETGEQCKALVVEYISLAPTVSHQNIQFIKNVTKISSNILKSDPNSLDGLLEKVFQFNNEGIQIIEENYTQNYPLNLKSHFFAYEGDVAKALFKKTQDVTWAKEWYKDYKTSADISIITDPKHAAYAYGFAGDAAKTLFETTREVGWAKKWYEATNLSANMTKGLDSRHSAFLSGIAGNAATTVYKETRQRKWYNRAIQSYRNLLEYYDLNPNSELQSLANYAESTIKFLKNRLPPLRK